MRRLASIRRIDRLEPIPGADKIEVATVDGWKVVVAKDVGHQEGDLIVYCEVDSFLPIKPEYEFLRKSSYKKMGDKEGFRLKTIRLRGQISQGLVLPISVLKGKIDFGPGLSFEDSIENMLGQDVSDILGIVKYEKPIPAQLSGKVRGNFPSFLQKTDEERVQNLDISEIAGKEWDVTEKVDGTSFTCYKYEGQFGVCSRNLELTETEDNTYWQVARKYNLERALPNDYALQGEIIGPGIQGNKYGLKEPKLLVFAFYSIRRRMYLNSNESIQGMLEAVMRRTSPDLEMVPTLPTKRFNQNIVVDDILRMAEGESKLKSGVEREGLVFKSVDHHNWSFKAISNKFLL